MQTVAFSPQQRILYTPYSNGYALATEGINSASKQFKESTKPTNKSFEHLQVLFKQLSIPTTVALFSTGVATSYLAKWFVKGFSPLETTLSKKAFRHLKLPNHQIERQTAVYFQKGLPAIVMMALKYPQLQGRLKSYLSASVLGYLGASLVQGVQETLVRQAETQVRADLLTDLKSSFEKSIAIKHQLDLKLKQHTLERIKQINQQFGLEINLDHNFSEGVLPTSYSNRYPFEPVHFNLAFSSEQISKSENMNTYLLSQKTLAKAVAVATGGVTGGLIQTLQKVLMQTKKSATQLKNTPHIKQTLLEITNAHDWEALFLMGNKKLLWSLLGLGALAKAGQLLVDGYREVEVTKQNAETEKRYQKYNWLSLDPSFRQIAEEQAVEQGLKKYAQLAFQVSQNNLPPKELLKNARTLLANIGRESAPKYFPMTPSVNLVAARS